MSKALVAYFSASGVTNFPMQWEQTFLRLNRQFRTLMQI